MSVFAHEREKDSAHHSKADCETSKVLGPNAREEKEVTPLSGTPQAVCCKPPVLYQSHVELLECGIAGVKRAKCLNHDTSSLEWDRFMRLRASANRLLGLGLPHDVRILDFGGFDGAISMFLPLEWTILVVDPATTGWVPSTLPFRNEEFDASVSVDAIEHVRPDDREGFLAEILRVTKKHIVLNWPDPSSCDAQKLVLSLTNHQFVAEHVHYGLPEVEWVTEAIKKRVPHARIHVHRHTSQLVWSAWFPLIQLDRSAGLAVSGHLKAAADTLVDQGPFLYVLLEVSMGRARDQ